MEEILDNAKEAIDLYLETLTVEEKKDLLKGKVVSIQKDPSNYKLKLTSS